MIFDLNQSMFGGPGVLDLGRPGISFVRGNSSGGDMPSTPIFISQQITTQIDTEDSVENPMGVSVPAAPIVSISTAVISETPVSKNTDLSVPAAPIVSISTFLIIPPANTIAPVISGTFEEDGELSCTTGTWTGTSPTYTYQWKSDDVDISGATGSTYTLTSEDIDAEISCTVTATNDAGSDSQDSNSLTA